jgi:hypothetical protein
MSFISGRFVGFALLFVLALQPRWRARWQLPLLTLLFVGALVPSWQALVPFVLFLAAGYLAVRLAPRLGRIDLAAIVGALVLSFAYLKQYAWLGALPRPAVAPFVIGLSYILFRLIHMVVDLRSGDLAGPISLADYLLYLLFPLSFLSGPLMRLDEFRAQARRTQPVSRAERDAALGRLLVGYLKVVVVAVVLQDLAENTSLARAAGWPHWQAALWLALGAVLFMLYLYFNFSGYMDVVLALGALVGWKLPENFDRPFSARSPIELWSRWHMTLSEWFRIYLFGPLSKALIKRGSPPAVAGVLAYFATFFVMGIWHGTTRAFVVYGLLLGACVSVNKIYQLAMTRRLGKKGYQALARRPAHALAGRAVTVSTFALSLTCWWVTRAQLDAALGAPFVLWLAVDLVLIAAGAALLFVVAAVAIPRLRVESAWARDLGAAVGLLVLYYAVLRSWSGIPEFIYQGF